MKKSPSEYIQQATGIRIEDGIQTYKVRRESVASRMTKMINGNPALLVDPTECPTALGGFSGGYCYPEIGNTGYYRPEPSKNRYSHIMDAGQYVASRIFRNVIERADDSRETYGFTNIAARYKPGQASQVEYYANV
jgi:hypothetical protein